MPLTHYDIKDAAKLIGRDLQPELQRLVSAQEKANRLKVVELWVAIGDKSNAARLLRDE